MNIGQHRFVGATAHVASYAEYTAENGYLKLTVPGHNIAPGEQIQIMENSMTFTCSMDDHYSDHVYPRSSDPATRKWLDVVESDIPGGTFTVNVGQSPIKGYTPTAATFNASTGALTLTIGSHSLAVGTNIKLAQQSLTFTCDMDDHATKHSYPRGNDPVHNEPIAITAVTSDSITVNVGTTPTVNYNVLGAAFNPADGNLSLTLDRKHSFKAESIHSISGATYNGETGLMRVKVADHNFAEGDFVKIADGGVSFTCSMDNHATVHAYPRSTDQMSGKWMAVQNASKDEFDVHVGKTPSIPFTISAADFDPTTGLMKMTIGDHDLRSGHSVRLAKESIVFTCYLDAHNSTHAYPRSTGSNYSGGADPFYNKPISILYDGSPLTATSGTFYNPTTGIMRITTDSAHGLQEGDSIKFALDSLVFRCDEDGQATDHTYPRATDPYANRWQRVLGLSLIHI